MSFLNLKSVLDCLEESIFLVYVLHCIVFMWNKLLHRKLYLCSESSERLKKKMFFWAPLKSIESLGVSTKKYIVWKVSQEILMGSWVEKPCSRPWGERGRRAPVNPLKKKKKFIWLCWGLSCSMWDLIPWPSIKPRPPALGTQRLEPLDYQRSPSSESFMLAFTCCSAFFSLLNKFSPQYTVSFPYFTLLIELIRLIPLYVIFSGLRKTAQ